MSKDITDSNAALLEAIDALATARAKERISVFCGEAGNAAYHSETAAQAKQLIKDILELRDRTLVAAIVKMQKDKS